MSDEVPPTGRSLQEMRGSSERVPPQAKVSQPRGPAPIAPEQHMPKIKIGFADMQSWEFTQRVANGFASSSLVPESYRRWIPKGKFGQAKLEMIENPSAIPNCIIALNMAERLGADPLMVMQNLYIVEGRPSWSAQFVISSINTCGRFTAIQYDVTDDGEQTIEFETETWDDESKSKIAIKKKATVPALSCVAWVLDKATGARLESVPISMEMAVLEGWYGRKGSKWQTPMRMQMLRYRSAAFLGRAYAPELLMGLRTADEEEDAAALEAERAPDGSYRLRPEDIEQQQEPSPSPAPTAQIEHQQTIQVDLGGRKPEPEKVAVKSAEPSQAQKDLQAALARGRYAGELGGEEKPSDDPPKSTARSTAKAQPKSGSQPTMDLGGDPRPAPPEEDDGGFGSGE